MVKALASSMSVVVWLAAGTAVSGCGGSSPPEGSKTPSSPDQTPQTSEAPKPAESAPATANTGVAATNEATPSGKTPTAKATPAFLLKDVGFATPESIAYDAADDVYLVSNVNGSPGAKDNNGFISRVSPDGKVLELKWIAGGKNGAKLDAPKGVSISGDTLYVADISTVRVFDRKTGKPKGETALAGATFVNDVFAAADGKVYASDSGIRITEQGPEATKTDAVWVIEKGKAKILAKGEELGRPNGIAGASDGVWVVTYGTNEIYRLDDKGKRQNVQKLPKGALDGVVALEGGGLLVSSWEGSAIYRGKPGGAFEAVVTDVKAPADIGYDAKRGRVLVPLFTENAIAAYELK